VDDRSRLAAESRDGHLALRRVERQQVLIERLVAARGSRVTASVLADELGVSARTVSRDLERLASSGVPIRTHPGRAGGVSLPGQVQPGPVTFDLSEAAALMSSLTVLGPTATGSAGSAMRKLAAALTPLGMTRAVDAPAAAAEGTGI
jgi:predicted DNA-binding transcriptional regulator YafY